MDNQSYKSGCSAEKSKKAVMLSKQELDRIVFNSQNLFVEEDNDDDIREERKQRLQAAKALSADMAQRKEPGSEAKKEQFATETDNVAKDLAREAKAEKRRNLVLEQAYKRLYEETDRVKFFKAAKDFALILKERDIQVSKKDAMKDILAKYESEYLLGVLRDMEGYEDEEKQKKKLKKENKKKNADNWIKQHKEVLFKKEREKWENLKDGYLIMNEVEEEKRKEEEKAKNAREQIDNYKMALNRQIGEKSTLFDIHQKLEKAKEAKAKLFDEAKKEMTLAHKKRKEKQDKEKQERRQRIANNLIDETGTTKTKEEETFQKAVRKAENKARHESALKKMNKEEAEKTIKEFYEKEMAAKQQRQQEDRLKSYQEGRDVIDAIYKLKQTEEGKCEKHSQLEKEAQHTQLHQIAEKEKAQKADDIEAIKDYLDHMRGLDEEEEMFQKYAQLEIENCEARGIDTYAMRKAARPGIECGKGPVFHYRGHIRPKYYPSVWNPEDLTHVDRKQNIPDTKSRLGFTFFT